MRDTANADCRILLDVLIGQGLRDAVMSPGSRNAPLLVGAAARPELDTRIVTDERTAGFMALGMAVASRRPVMLCCTSGTAMYNYAPAVAEAMYQKVPLIVVTADRPARWIDQDDSQTLRQPDALSHIVKRSYNITVAEGENRPCAAPRFATEREWFVNRTVNEAWLTATHGVPGPVHINIQLDTPLGETEDVRPQKQRIVNVVESSAGLDPETAKRIAARLSTKRVLVTAGFMPPDHRLSRTLQEFMRMPNVALCAEPLSNLRVAPDNYQIDSLLHGRKDHTELEREIKETLRPDVVISIGGALVSRMLKEYLRHWQPEEIYTLGDTDCSVDCFQGLTTHVDVKPEAFFHGIAGMTQWLERRNPQVQKPDYAALWSEMRRKYCVPTRKFAEGHGLTEMKAFNEIFRQLPEDYNLFLSNGTAVRYGGICMERMPHAVYGNRGVSGIEGTTATAAGIAIKYSGPTLLVTGDMSFGYNPQLMGNELVPDNFRIIVINNRGGGIFRFIRNTRGLAEREEYFCADRSVPLQALASAYGWQYLSADTAESLHEALTAFFSHPGRTLLEISVDPQSSADLLISYLET